MQLNDPAGEPTGDPTGKPASREEIARLNARLLAGRKPPSPAARRPSQPPAHQPSPPPTRAKLPPPPLKPASSARIDGARKLLAMGIMPVPIPFGEKGPRFDDWQNFRTTDDAIPHHFAGPGNVGMMLGAVSGDLIDADLDSAEAVAVADEFLPDTGMVFGRPGKPRSHRMYRATGVTAKSYKDIDGTMLVELRTGQVEPGGGKGHQTLAPPSIHPSGEQVAFDSDKEPSPVEPDEIETAIARIAVVAILARHIPQHSAAHDACLALAGGLARSAFNEDEAVHLVSVICQVKGIGDWRDRENAIRSTFAKYAKGEPTQGWPALAGIIGSEVVDRVREWLGDEQRAVNFEIVPASRLCTEHPALRPYVIDGLLRKGETCNLIAASKVGKTHFATDLALSVASGRKWLDTFPVAYGTVLYLDDELHATTSAYRIHAIRQARGLTDRDLDNLHMVHLRGQPCDLNQLAPHLKKLGDDKYRLIIIDSLYRLLPEGVDENSNADVTKLYNTLDSYAAMTGAAIFCVHHTSKGSQSEKAVTDIGSGAGAQSRAADTHITLRAHADDDCVRMDAAIRSFKPIAPIVLRRNYPLWRVDPTMDPDNLQTSKGKKRDDDLTPASFAATFVTADPQSKKDIIASATAGQIPRDRARDLFDDALDHGLIVETRPHRGAAPGLYARAPQDNIPTTEGN